MPNFAKAVISALVLIVGVVAHRFEQQSGNESLSWVIAGLACFMILALWLFPETGKGKH